MLILKVARGLHAGAELALQERSYLIGSDESSCDVVLLDGGVRPQHARLIVTSGGHVFLEQLDDSQAANGMEIGSVSLAPDAVGRMQIDDGVEIDIGAAQIVLSGIRNKVAMQGAPAEAAASTTNADADLTTAPYEMAVSSAPTDSVVSQPRWRGKLFGGLATVFVVIFAIGGALAVAETVGSDDREVRQVEAVLRLLGYVSLEVESDERGQPIVTGYLPSQTDLERLRSTLVARRCNAVLHIAVRSAVQQFDTGLEKTRYQVVSSGDDVTLIEPKPAEAPRRPPPAVNLRIRSASTGDDAYIETETGQRFYIGSALPGGFELAGVTSQGVVVKKGEHRLVVPVH